MSQCELKPVFIGGHRKCGTSMLLNLFDGHPELCVYPVDLTVLYAYFPTYNESEFSLHEHKDRLDTVIFKQWERQEELSNKLDINTLRESFFRRMQLKSYVIKDIIEELLLNYRELSGPAEHRYKGTIAKETSIEIYANHLFEWFPCAKFIHLIRDPRDNYAALKDGIQEYYSRFGDDPRSLLHSLLERCHLGMKLADANCGRFGLERYKVVIFEDLVSRPFACLKEICGFLEITYNECLMVPTVLGNIARGNSFGITKFSNISRRNVGRWRERILADEAKVIEFHFRDLMKRFGYEPAFTETQQADAAAEFYKWSNYKYHYYDRFKENGG